MCRPSLPPFLPFFLHLSSARFLGQLYHQSAVVMLQQLVDNWIMNSEGGTNTPSVARVTDFPNPEYSDDGFWTIVS